MQQQMLIIGVCILLRVYPVILINHRTQQFFFVLFFIVHLHYMFRPLIGGHLQVICDKIYCKVANRLCQRIRWVDVSEASAVLM
jgi:hypothetical protein